MSSKPSSFKVIAVNRRARFDYEILETFEAGIVLKGSEVKSLRLGKASIVESFVGEMTVNQNVEVYLFNSNILPYEQAKVFNHEPKAPRKLLLHRKQKNKLLGSIQRKGLTVIPLQLYFNQRGRAKLEIALGKGKKTVDKRQTIKERDWKREQLKTLKNYSRQI